MHCKQRTLDIQHLKILQWFLRTPSILVSAEHKQTLYNIICITSTKLFKQHNMHINKDRFRVLFDSPSWWGRQSGRRARCRSYRGRSHPWPSRTGAPPDAAATPPTTTTTAAAPIMTFVTFHIINEEEKIKTQAANIASALQNYHVTVEQTGINKNNILPICYICMWIHLQ